MLVKGTFSLFCPVFANFVLTALLNVSPVGQDEALCHFKTKFMLPSSLHNFLTNPLTTLLTTYYELFHKHLKMHFHHNNMRFPFSKPFIPIGTQFKILFNFNCFFTILFATGYMVCF